MGLSAILAFESLAYLWITKQIIDLLTKFAAAGIGQLVTLGPMQIAALATLLAAQLALWVGSRLVSSVFHVIQTDAQGKFELNIMRRIMKKCESLDLAFFESSENIDRVEKCMRGSLMSAWNVIWMTFDLARTFVQALTLMLVLVLLNPLAPIVVAISTLPQLFANSEAARERFKLWRDHSTESRLLYYFPWQFTDKSGAVEIKFFNLSEYFRQQYEHFHKLHQEKHRKTMWKEQAIDFFWTIVSSTGAIFIYVYICVFAVLRRITTGDAVLYMGAVDSFQGALRGVFFQSAQIYEHLLYLKELFGLLDQKPEEIEGALARSLAPENAPRQLQQGIEFRNVSFTYPHGEREILSDISFTLPPKQSVAIVGKNGAGKSTLVKLLLRLYDPTKGSILLDGTNLKDIELNSYRDICSSIFQDFNHYSLTLRENVGFGDIENIHDTQRVEEAIAVAGAASIKERMPKGLDGYLTKHYADDGEELSGGEWQKVALARALMRNNAQIIILDEPTAALDSFAEYEMFKLFGELTEDRVSILISHRFSTVRLAKKILVLDEGKLVEEGSHKELMAKNGLYAEMYSKQADRYK
jgi:ATP-binding cassette, subfamily B, bacterial